MTNENLQCPSTVENSLCFLIRLTGLGVDFELGSARLLRRGVDGVEEALVLVQVGRRHRDDVGAGSRVLRHRHLVQRPREHRPVVVDVQHAHQNLKQSPCTMRLNASSTFIFTLQTPNPPVSSGTPIWPPYGHRLAPVISQEF